MDIRRRILRNKTSTWDSDTSGYKVLLNNQWRQSASVSNPDSSTYEGVYESYSNYNTNSTAAIMYIDINGLSTFKLYIRSYAESNYDYVMVSQLDKSINNSSSYSDTTLVKAYTRGNQQSGTTISNYTLVEFTGIDKGSHRITVLYRKDSSQNKYDDRGYVLIPKDQGGENSGDEPDIEIDTTYAIYYTSSDGNVVTPYKTDVFGANIVSNNYINGQGIISFDGPITSIGYLAFNRGDIKRIIIPDSVTTIGDYAFSNCQNITSVNIPNSVTTVGENAFKGCSSLTSVTIPNSVTSIGDYAFYNCTSLTSITIPDSVTEIGSCTFKGCSNLTSVAIPNSVTKIGSYAFYGCINLTSVTIPDSVTTIEEHAFYGCHSLTMVTIGDSVKSIGNSAFRGCSALQSITIPDFVTSIGNYAFYDCDNLTSVTIGYSVTSIGNFAFELCDNLTSVYCIAATPPLLGSSSVFPYNDRKIYVPAESAEAYKTANGWSNYADSIEGYNFE